MKLSTFIATLFIALAIPAAGGPFAPAAGQPGSTAVHHLSPDFVFWADGFVNFLPGIEGDTFDNPADALGPPTGDDPLLDVYDVVSLGRGGEITLTFANPIANGDGADFAVFENGFSDFFLELGFVEVSDDGVTFVRFPSTSLTATPVPAFAAVDPTDIDGLAGKYRVGYGTPFDLATVGLSAVTHVRLIDIVGDGGATDSSGSPIYDPYPTEGSAGIDVDAVGALNDEATFAAWQVTSFDAAERADPAHSGAMADPNSNGLANLAEYAFDLDPENDAPPGSLPAVSLTGGTLVIRFTRFPPKTDITYHVDVSDDLDTWEEIARSSGGGATVATGHPSAAIAETGGSLVRDVTVTDSAPAATCRFARVRITKP